MKVIYPYSYFDNWFYLRYKEQFKHIADNIDELNIVVRNGVKVKNDIDNCNIHYQNIIERNSWNKKINKGIKYKLRRFSGRNLLIKYNKFKEYALNCSCIDADLVYGMSGSGWLEYYHNLLGDYKNIPVIHRLRGYGRYTRKKNMPFEARITNEFFESIAYRKYDYHIPISDNFKRILIKRGISENIISKPIGLGVDTNIFDSKTLNGDYIGFIGRFTPVKNIPFLFKLMKSTPDINYLLVGENTINNVPDNCKVIGRVPKYKVPEYIEMCKAILLPSLSEGIANIILETYSCSRIIIGSYKAIDSSLPVYGFKLDFNIDNWKKVIYGLENYNLKPIYKKARKWALKNDWSLWGKTITNEMKKVVEYV